MIIYEYNDAGIFTGSKQVEADYQLSANETKAEIPVGLQQPYTLVNGVWTGTASDSAPSAEQQMIMQLSSDNVQFKQLIMTQATQIATLQKGSAS